MRVHVYVCGNTLASTCFESHPSRVKAAVAVLSGVAGLLGVVRLGGGIGLAGFVYLVGVEGDRDSRGGRVTFDYTTVGVNLQAVFLKRWKERKRGSRWRRRREGIGGQEEEAREEGEQEREK